MKRAAHHRPDLDRTVRTRVLGLWCEQVRTERSLFQKECAELLGCTPTYISRLERGAVIPDAFLGERIAIFLGVSLTAMHALLDRVLERAPSLAATLLEGRVVPATWVEDLARITGGDGLPSVLTIALCEARRESPPLADRTPSAH